MANNSLQWYEATNKKILCDFYLPVDLVEKAKSTFFRVTVLLESLIVNLMII
jgi:hypothetical protein